MSTGIRLIRTALGAAVALVLLGCSSGTGANRVNPQGSHPADWTQSGHWLAFTQDPASCTPCHGSYLTAAASGGVSGVSCFQCHHPNGPQHVSGWELPTGHGLAAMSQPGTQTGFATCATCHGLMDSTGAAESCTTCHTTAPHPPTALWTNPAAGSQSHEQTNQGNAPVCFTCHQGGNNSTLKPSAPPAQGAAPGCFNNTMCHSNSFEQPPA